MFRIIVGSHYFRVCDVNSRVRGVLYTLSDNYSIKGWVNVKGRRVFKVIKRYVSIHGDSREFRLHIGQLKPFITMLSDSGIFDSDYTIEYLSLYTPMKCSLLLRDGWVLRDYQNDCKEYILKDDRDALRSKMVSMPTGTGKTVTALATLSTLNNPIVIAILPTYIEKWASDCMEILDISPKDIMCIRGGKQLKGLVDAAKNNPPNCKIYIISLKTIQNAIKDIESHNGNYEELGFTTAIDEMYENLQVGTLLIDEVHQHLHAVYKLVTNANVPSVLGLSATLMSNDSMLDSIQHMMFPKELRYNKVKMEKYIKTVAISYNFINLKNSDIKFSERGSTSYSHIAFERSILKNAKVKKGFMTLIENVVKTGFITDYKDGDKLAIFAATMKMCDAILDHLHSKFPTLDIRRYMEKDPYVNAIESDIRVTTLGSMGVAIDVPNLRSVILTNSISSPVANLQVLGRLRDLKDRDVKFFYLYSNQISKQRAYHLDKIQLFKDRILGLTELHYPIPI